MSAVSPGEREAGRWSHLAGLAGGPSLPWVSANALLPAGEGEVPDHRLFEFPGMRVGVVGLGASSDDSEATLFAAGPDRLGETLQGLRSLADRIVVFGSVPLTQLAMISARFPEVTAILTGFGAFETSREPLVLGRTVVAAVGEQGKTLIDLRLDLSEPQPRVLSYRLVSLDREVTAEADWDRRVAATLRRIRDIERARALEAAPLEPSPTFAGSEACAGCHASETDVWRGSAHARAFETLERDGLEFDPQCVGCHVTGWRQDGGFVDAVRTPGLRDVQCEACHGPGLSHAEDPASVPGYGRIADSASQCRTCHTPEQTDHFDHATAWQAIAH